MTWLDARFQLAARGTSARQEAAAGLTTFLTMSYVLFVHPQILAVAGMDPGAVFTATCLASALGCALMGLLADLPIALAPGMGLNAYFAYTVVQGEGVPWPVALGAVFLSGLLFFGLGLVGVRQLVIQAFPDALQHGIAAGIGLFLGLLGLKQAGVVVDHPATLVTLGDLGAPTTLLAAAGFLLTVGLAARGWRAAVLIGILAVTAASVALGVSPAPGGLALPPDPRPVLGQLDVGGALDLGVVSVVLTFLFVDLFDNSGTLVGVAHAGGLLDAQGQVRNVDRAMLADSLAAAGGAAIGTSTTTSYIESVAGIAAGGRTGLTSLVVGGLFLLSLFAAPLATSVPPHATAGALLYVAVLMAGSLARVDTSDPAVAAAVLVAALTTPLTFSIATGIALGVLTWVGGHLAAGRRVNPVLAALALVFAARFAWLGGG